ncbi:MAG TPA: Ig-like domain-containing protein, partial [Chryseosolibacter sp.]
MKVRSFKTGLTRSLFLFAFGLLSTVAYGQTVTSVTAAPNTGSFNQGDVIVITINFSAAVDIDATKSIALTLETGTTDAVVTYGGVDQLNVTSMQLSYTVGATHTSSDLQYVSTTSLVLQANAIEEAGGTADIDATLPALATAQSLGGSASIIIDTTPPVAPSAPDLASGSDSGTSNSDDITNVTTPTVTGTAEDGATVTITSSVNGVVGTGTATGGNYSIALSALNEGAHNLTAVATDVAGNASTASTPLAITIDVTAPAAPGNPVLDASSDTGASSADQITSDDTPLITGTGVNGTILTLTSNVSGTIGSMTVAGGVYSITSSALSAGAHVITATARDVAGNATAAAMTLSMTVDTSAPSTPGMPDLDNADDSGSSNTDNVTNVVTNQTFSGTTEANASVEIFNGVSSLGTTTANGAGAWSIDLNLGSGTYNINIKAKDAAGNTSAASPDLAFVVDTSAPATPSVPDLASGSDSGSSNSDDITNDNTPTLTGTAEADAVITITSDINGVVGTGTATGGNYSVTVSALNETSHNLTAVATDLAGNASAATTALAVTIDVTAPAAPGTPDLDATSDSGTSSTDDYTNDNTPLITGTGVNGTTVNLTSNISGALGSVAVAGGTYSITSSTLASGGHTITATATDVAGNTSTVSGSLSMTVDTSAPAVPTALDLAAADDTGSSNTDNLTKNTTGLTISGSSDPSIAIELFRAGSISLGTTTATGAGTWSLDVSLLTEATHSVTAVATDQAGNASAASSPLAIQIDFTAPASAPAAPNLDTSTDTGFSSTDNITNDATPNFTFSNVGGVANLRLNIYSSIDGFVGFTTADGSGGVGGSGATVTLVTDGTHTMTAKAADAAGNESAASSSLNVTLDRVAPTISFPVVFSYNGNSRETMVISFSETIGLADNVTIANSANSGKRGFYANEGDIRDAGSLFDDATNKLTLQSVSDGQWSAGDGSPTQITYTNTSGSATAAESNPTNLIRDLAGNEMATVNFVGNDGGPPALATGFVFFPNGAAAETVVVQVDETLILAEGAAVTGFTTSQGVPASAIYSGKGTSNTITFTSPGPGTWTESILFTYTQASGNVTDPSSNELLAFSNAPIRLINISIASNNANGFTQKAKTGDLITLNFTANGTLTPAPTATIGGVAATISGGPTNYTATLVAPAGLTEGVLPIQIIAETAADSTTVSATTNDSQIVFDKTSPTISNVAIASTNASPSLAKPNDDVSVTFTVNESLATTPTVTIAGRAASVSNIGLNYTATITMNGTDPEGVLAFSIALQDQVGNASSTSATNNASSVTYDRTLPTISSIAVPPLPGNLALNGIGSSNGTTSSTITYTVTFDGNVSGVDATDFSLTSLGDVSGLDAYPAASGSISPIVAGGPQVYTVTVNSVSGTGRLRLNFVSDGSVTDASGNANTAGFTTGQTYTVVLPQPPVHVTGFGAVAVAPTTASIKLDWVLPGIVAQRPSHFLIRVQGPDNADNPGTFPAANDGTYVSNDFDFSDGAGAVNVSGNSTTYTFTTLLSGKDYTFEIIPYNLSPNTTVDNINFLNILMPSATASTTSAAVGRFTQLDVAPPTISSLTTSYSTDVNFAFQVTDDGTNPADDNSKTRFSTLVIYQSAGSISNWSDLIEEAQLTDSEGNTITSTGSDIGSSYIIFNTPTTNDAIGEVDDNETKTYNLRIRLKNPILNGADQTIDNQRFEFAVYWYSFGYLLGSSEILPGESATSDPTLADLNNKITVVATALNFVTQPQGSPYVLVGLAPVPKLQAQDANGNRDLDYAQTVIVSNAGTIPMLALNASPANSLVAASGEITFPSGFRYGDDGNGTLTVTDGTLTSLPSSAVTVIYSNTSTITAPVVPSNQNIPSTATGQYSAIGLRFRINEDNLSVASDNAATLISQIVFTKGAGNTVANWSDVIAGAMLYDFNGPPYTHGVVGADDITFSGIDLSPNGYT